MALVVGAFAFISVIYALTVGEIVVINAAKDSIF